MNLDQFKHSVALDALSLPSVLTPLLHQYRQGLDHTILANNVLVDMSVIHHGSAENAWTAVPADGEQAFLKAAVRVSVQLQRTLRCWLQMHWFARPENFADTSKTAALLAYLACKPFYPKVKNAYAYDLMDDWSISTLERLLRPDMADVLSRVANQLRILGQHELADFYDPSHATWFIKEVERNGKMFYDLLAREFRLVQAWVPLIGSKLTQRQMDDARRETRFSLNEIFRRGEDLSYLTPLFEMEVAAVLEAYIGAPVGRVLTLSGNPLLHPKPASNVIPFPVSGRRTMKPYNLIDKAA